MKCHLQGDIETKAQFPRLESRFFNYLVLFWFAWVVFGFGGVFFLFVGFFCLRFFSLFCCCSLFVWVWVFVVLSGVFGLVFFFFCSKCLSHRFLFNPIFLVTGFLHNSTSELKAENSDM